MEAPPASGIDGMPPAKVITEIHKQLLTGFQPATKAVAECGTTLVRTFQTLYKQCDAYIRAVEALAHSGEKAFLEGKRKAAELNEVVSRLKSINGKHKENIDRFADFVAKTNEYSREEKEKLKDLSHAYESKEKNIKKYVAKGVQDQVALEKFYNEEMEAALKQQSQRYKFAADKHTDWLKSYVELLQFASNLVGGKTTQSIVESEQQKKPENVAPETSFNAAPENLNHDAGVPTENGDEDAEPGPAGNKASDSLQWIPVEEQKPEPKFRDAATSYAQDLKDLAVMGEEDNTLKNFILIKPSDPRPPIQPKRMTVPPHQFENSEEIVNLPTADNYYESPRRKPADEKPSTHKDVQTEITTEAWMKPSYQSSAQNSVDETPPIPPVRNVQHNEKPPIAARNEERRPVSNLIRPNGVMYRPHNVHAIPTAFIPPAFRDSDNGRLLVCVSKFQGQTANQLSLNVGDRIVLIKSGTQGWIFAKHVETQKTGWFPTLFVQMLPDVEEETAP